VNVAAEARWADLIDRLHDLADDFAVELEDEGDDLDNEVAIEVAAEKFCAFVKRRLSDDGPEIETDDDDDD